MSASAKYNAVAIPAHNFNELHVAAAAALTPGDLYLQADGTVCAYAGLEAAAIADEVVFYRTGAYWVLCNATSDTYVAGAAVYFDTVNKVARTTLADGNCRYLGVTEKAKTTGSSRVLVQINNNNPTSAGSFTTLSCTTLTATGAGTLSATWTWTNAGLSFLYGTGAAAAASGLIIGGGTTANPCTTATASAKFLELRCRTTATSGDNRLAYLRYDVAGAGAGGECLRAYTAMTAAGSTCPGAHVSLDVSATGYITGLGAGVRGQLYVTGIVPAGGTYYGMMAEMYFDPSATIAAPTEHAILAIQANGDATAAATCLNAISFVGGAASGGGQMISPGSSMSTVTGTIRVLINGAVRYIPYYSHEGHA